MPKIKQIQTFIESTTLTYHIEQIASVIGGKFLARHDNAVISELLLDSRKAVFPASSLFFALKGPRRDGHAFVKEAHQKGVRNFVVSEGTAAGPDANIILVPDVMASLQTLAAWHRSRFSIPVVGITGSNGKTVVKEWLNQLLSGRFNIVRSPKSYNSQIGVPLSVWQLNETANLAIIEAGISQTGEMQRLQPVIRPTIGVFTNIGDAHAEGFLDIRQKIREKLRLFVDVGTLVYCKDHAAVEEEVRALRDRASKPFDVLRWSVSEDAELSVRAIDKKEKETAITAVYKGAAQEIVIPFTDAASIENAISCWCVLLILDIPAAEIKSGMSALHPVAMRLDLRNGINHTSVINDSYSADLSSLRIALDFLSQQHQHPKRTVILADFLESGRPEQELYSSIASSLSQHGVQRLIGIGPVISGNRTFFQQNAAGERSFIPETLFFSSVEEFRQEFPRIHFGNETILIKGARVFELEQVSKMLEMQTHQTLLEIDLDALVHNLRAFQRLLKPSTKVMAMVKAFSYGSGSYEIASALQFNKVDYLTVAYADEGVELRKGGITLPIMVMNPDELSFSTLVSYNLEPEMYSLGLIGSFGRYLMEEGLSQYPIHIELETGMNRLGFSPGDLEPLLERLQGNSFRVMSVFSHLVGSEDAALDPFTLQQAELFTAMSGRIGNVLPYPFLKHLLNTSGISRHGSLQFDMVRIGIGLYGIDSSGKMDLKEVSTLKSSIAQLKLLKAGDSVSYGRTGKVLRDSIIATVRLGYADGYSRSLGNGKGMMMVNGLPAPTIGNICMDMTMIDVTDIPGIAEGAEVIVFGKKLPVTELASLAGTIPYEILTGVSQRVKRVYFQE